MKILFCIFFTFFIISILVGSCSRQQDSLDSQESKKVYTYEELAALPSDQLLSLFVENGLEINEGLNEIYTDEEFEEFFKSNFELLHEGNITLDALMYWDLAEKTAEIYQKLTKVK